MNINDDYQKRRGQTTSSPTRGIIEPNKKYLESNSFYPLSNLIFLRIRTCITLKIVKAGEKNKT